MGSQANDSSRHVAGKKSSEGGRGNPEKASPAAVEKYLKGIHFPANKSDLVEHAKNNDAPEDVINVLNKFDERDYQGVADVAKEIGSIE